MKYIRNWLLLPYNRNTENIQQHMNIYFQRKATDIKVKDSKKLKVMVLNLRYLCY